MTQEYTSLHCRRCGKALPLDPTALFCPYCGTQLNNGHSKERTSETTLSFSSTAATLVPGHIPQQDPIQFSIGPYQILRAIGKGGMGEVFLAYDTTCGRRIALKRIRADLVEHRQMHRRFLKEARITSQLTHPAIIPIYTIHDEAELVYYTMPYVEGGTLKQILNNARQKEKLGQKMDHEESIPSLIHIFLSICQAVGYAHAKGVLHRDLKPENIIVGKYGEVLILDWGLAKLIPQAAAAASSVGSEIEEEEELATAFESHPLHSLTHLGKVVGTLSYMAPERALGQEATFQTDIYALGVILYQILTLRYPFHRKTLKEFKQKVHLERLYDPTVIAPYRDVPELLSKIVLKSLSINRNKRYQTVDELLHALKSYIEGRSEWSLAATLDIEKQSDWEFQENILIAEHIAITRGPEISSWVSLMVSKNPFDQNAKIETSIFIGEHGEGLGFLFNVPEAPERVHLNDGYTLWIGSDINYATKLSRSTVEVLHAPEVFLKRNQWYKVTIENVHNHIHFYLDDVLQFSYHGLLPLLGTHVGLISRDADFSIAPIKIFTGGQSITLTCLAVPDAFLAHKDYKTALSEYRRIGLSFPGRAEGREALFRSGMTLLEQARTTEARSEREKLYEEMFAEFEKLHGTPGAPLEYLGKAIAYQSLGEWGEELKCLELALRRYKAHPLLTTIREHILYRMHESSRFERSATYSFILLVLRNMTDISKTTPISDLLKSLEKNWEQLPFIAMEPAISTHIELRNLFFATQLSFWLNKAYTLVEICDATAAAETSSPILLGNALFCLIEMGAWKDAKDKIKQLQEEGKIAYDFSFLEIGLMAYEKSVSAAADAFMQHKKTIPDHEEIRVALHLMEKALDAAAPALASSIANSYDQTTLLPEQRLAVDAHHIWALLQERNWDKAGQLLHGYPPELFSQETSILHFLYGCWLYATEEREIALIHFSTVLETIHPHSWMLFSHYHTRDLESNHGSWQQKCFPWERKQLYRQLALFYHCAEDEAKSSLYRKKLQEENFE